MCRLLSEMLSINHDLTPRSADRVAIYAKKKVLPLQLNWRLVDRMSIADNKCCQSNRNLLPSSSKMSAIDMAIGRIIVDW